MDRKKNKKMKTSIIEAPRKITKEVLHGVEKTSAKMRSALTKTGGKLTSSTRDSLHEKDAQLKENLAILVRGTEKINQTNDKTKEGDSMKKKQFSQKTVSLWNAARKDLHELSKNAKELLTKGAAHMGKKSEKAEDELHLLSLTLQREKLYYELGKSVGSFPKKPGYQKRKLSILNKIKIINKKIKNIKKAIRNA